MSGPQGSADSPGVRMLSQGPPYAPRNQGLGGNPEVIPDVPITAIFLVLYLVFGIIHIKIFKANKGRGHKFIFNGAILGLCKIRIITMSLRIAWACHPQNIGLGIAANVFVYVGTIILFMIDWFFVQRIVRAQHQRLGWSTPYRIFHRGALAVLVITLIMIILVNIWQFFTASSTKLHVFRALQLTGQTYFTVFCFAPAILVLISGLIPRTEIEKFGAGRLRVNIAILLIAVAVLTTGQLFRCVIAWIPQTPVFNSAGQPISQPWYLHKACFYIFNFVTEIIVIVMFALVRVDLRFHVPNGSRVSGDYSGRNSRVNLTSASNVHSHLSISHSINKKGLPCEAPTVPMSQPNGSTETLHRYETSVFEDTHTLADSLQYTGSTLEVDRKTGNWKVKRLSGTSVSSRSSNYSLADTVSPTKSSFNDRSIKFADDVPPVPPVPEIPSEWPLPSHRPSHSSISHSSSLSRIGTPKKTFEIANHGFNGVDVGNTIEDALAALETNSEQYGKLPRRAKTDATRTANISAISRPGSTHAVQRRSDSLNASKSKPTKNPLAPQQRSTFPPKSALKTFKNHASTHSVSSTTPTIDEAPEVTLQPLPTSQIPRRRTSSIEFITLSRKPSTDGRKIIDMSLQGDKAGDISRPPSSKDMMASSTEGSEIARVSSSVDSEGTTSWDAKDHMMMEESHQRFSFEPQRLY
ncbi:hypothetical protein HBI14_088680 [Parastagonospora nodorum]|nr:hypothetical protein HBI14_088680 [Parastagonospora nodorum]